MALVNMKEMLNAARRARKAVGAFNVTNYETAARWPCSSPASSSSAVTA